MLVIDKEMAAINRKQIPLCMDCHLKVHSGRYDGISLKKLNDESNIAKKSNSSVFIRLE